MFFQTKPALMLDVKVTKSSDLLLYKHLLRVLQEQEPSDIAEKGPLQPQCTLQKPQVVDRKNEGDP